MDLADKLSAGLVLVLTRPRSALVLVLSWSQLFKVLVSTHSGLGLDLGGLDYNTCLSTHVKANMCSLIRNCYFSAKAEIL